MPDAPHSPAVSKSSDPWIEHCRKIANDHDLMRKMWNQADASRYYAIACSPTQEKHDEIRTQFEAFLKEAVGIDPPKCWQVGTFTSYSKQFLQALIMTFSKNDSTWSESSEGEEPHVLALQEARECLHFWAILFIPEMGVIVDTWRTEMKSHIDYLTNAFEMDPF